MELIKAFGMVAAAFLMGTYMFDSDMFKGLLWTAHSILRVGRVGEA